jgi:lipid II isoglutaminyl synthase (glutamine-hydrolysing)
VGTESAVRVVEVFPDLLGTYGDRGNALVLAHRCLRRGIECDVLQARAGSPIPRDGDIYLLGGGEDAAQTAATEFLREDGTLKRAADEGKAILAICAGLQILGTEFTGGEQKQVAGLGIVDIASRAGTPRAIGELVLESAELGELCGFENHAGRTTLGPDVSPLGIVRAGTGNGTPDDGTAHGDGFVVDRVVGTYMHGPGLARNPALADLLLGWVVGELEPLEDPLLDQWRQERVAASGRVSRH